jgi:hypothetical protein
MAWVYEDSQPAANHMGVVAKYTTSGNYEYAISWNYSTKKFLWSVSGDGTNVTSLVANGFGATSTATWYFIVAWHDADNNEIGIEVNGVHDTQSYATGMYDGTGAFDIGRYAATTNNCWDGRIDSVGMWRRVLTSSERTWLYNAGSGCEYPFTACDATATATAVASNTPTATMTSTITPTWTATATPPIWESHTLDGGNLYVIERRATYGEIAVAIIGLLVLAAFGLRWIFQLVMGAFQQWLL